MDLVGDIGDKTGLGVMGVFRGEETVEEIGERGESGDVSCEVELDDGDTRDANPEEVELLFGIVSKLFVFGALVFFNICCNAE